MGFFAARLPHFFRRLVYVLMNCRKPVPPKAFSPLHLTEMNKVKRQKNRRWEEWYACSLALASGIIIAAAFTCLLYVGNRPFQRQRR
jgi:hypothetical protein